MSALDLANVITVTLLSALKGVANLNTSIIALFTTDAPISSGYGDYGIYLNPTGVGQDFGITSTTYRLANDVFSQNPNILSGNGYLVIIPLLSAATAQPATILCSAPVNLLALTATDYNIKLTVDGGSAIEMSIGQLDLTSIATVEASLNYAAMASLGVEFSIDGTLAAANITLKTSTTGATAAITISPATTGTDIAPLLNIAGTTATGAAAGAERVKDAILRTMGETPYFGILMVEKPADADLEELAAMVQTMDKLLFVASSVSTDITGVFKTLLGSSMTHTRCLFYSVSVSSSIDFAACYAGRALSINFSGVNTAHTMHLKDLVDLVADSGLTQTLLTSAMNNGVDTFPDLGGIAKVFTSGVNMYFDQIYTREAFKTQLQTAGFNYLAQTNTKIPQTEQGMSGLKAALRTVCKQFVTNGVFAPGSWTDPIPFGNPTDFTNNINGAGFYIYSIPIASQSAVDRTSRIAPPISIAAKDAGAIHSANVTVVVNA